MKADPMERLREAFIDGGKEAIERDPELRALLDASPEFQRTLAAMEDVDAALPSLEPTRMPAQLLDKILAIDDPQPRGFFSWFRLPNARDYALGVAAALMMLMPFTAMYMLAHQRPAELEVLDLQPTIVRLDVAAIEERALPKQQDAEAVHTVADAPQVRIALEPRLPRYKERVASNLASKQWPAVNAAALVNAYTYAPAKEDVDLHVEVGPTPWSSETRLVRVYVSTKAEAKEAALQISFNDERVASYRRVAEPGSGGITTESLQDGAQFTALFEIVPIVRIGQVLRDDSVYASLRYIDVGGERRLLQREGIDRNVGFDQMSIDYRFAAAAAWFANEIKAGPQAPGLAMRLQRLMATASRALGGDENKKERVTLVAMARAASDQAH